MKISLETVQELAPDQASLTAAKKLLKPAKWPVLGQTPSLNIIWSECQGSGANPYYTVVDAVNHGYKCTCPSRKFPCKHALALLWQYAESSENFADQEAPQWAIEWLGRRRKTTTEKKTTEKTTTDPKPAIKKEISAVAEEAIQLSPEEIAKKEAAQAKRSAQNKAKTDASVSEGMLEFHQWLDDQLINGISVFIKEINERCRRIASRLVDAKASNFASRIDEIPAKILTLPSPQQPDAVYEELGKLALLSEAWLTDCDDIEVRRAIVSAETREQVLSNPKSIRVKGIWQTVGERTETRKDGLIAHSKWLVNISSDNFQSALLLDYYPAAVGRKDTTSSIGRKIEAELVYYPARIPYRALLGEFSVVDSAADSQHIQTQDYQSTFQRYLTASPWLESFPAMLATGKIVTDSLGGYWWLSSGDNESISLSNEQLNPVILGSELTNAFVISNGKQAQLMSVHSQKWGVIPC